MELHRYPDREALVRALTDVISTDLSHAIAARGAASLVVPGGSTPGPLFDALAATDLAWAKVTVTLNDERWVAPTDDGSNEKLVRARLLTGTATAASFIGLKTPSETAHDAVGEIEARLAAITRPFDVMLLGMGENGHTASLFPGSTALAASLEGDTAEVQAVEAEGARGSAERVSMALPTLIDARHIVLMITGEAKLQVLERAAQPGDPLELPIRAVLARADVEVHWAP